MTATLLSGTGETTIQNTDNNPRAMDAAVYELEPSAAPLTVLMNAFGSMKTTNPKCEWLQDEPMPRYTTLTSTGVTGITAWTVTADIFRVGDVVKFPGYGWGLLVTATGANAISGTVLGTQSTISTTGAEAFIIGNANAEFATLREIKFTQLNTEYNYVQNVRTPFGISGDEDATSHYGGDERARLRKHFGIEHARTLDDCFAFGIRSISSTTRTMGGLTQYITTNTQVGTTLTEDEWQTGLIQGFRYGSDRKIFFGSPLAISVIEGFARNNLAPNANVLAGYGVSMKEYISGQGTVGLVNVKKWADSATYGGYGFLLDMEDGNVQERWLRKTRLRPDVQTPSADGFQDEYLTGTCIQVKHERKCQLWTGITRAT